MLLQSLGRSKLTNTDRVNNGDCIEREVARVAKLTADGEITEYRVDRVLVVGGQCGCLQMLNKLADPQNLPSCSELLLDSVERLDGGLGAVGAVEVPSIEAGEVLQGSKDLIATD